MKAQAADILMAIAGVIAALAFVTIYMTLKYLPVIVLLLVAAILIRGC